MDFPRGGSGKEPACQSWRLKRCRFNPWVGKIPWRRKWQPTPVFLPGKSHGWRSLAGYSEWGSKESDMTEQLSLSVIFKLGKYKGLDALSWAGGEWYRRWKTASKVEV